MSIQGVFASDAGIVGDRRSDFAAGLLQIMPTGTAMLFALSAGMQSAPASDVIINWFEESHISGRVTIDSFVTDGDGTGFVVSDASSFIPGVVLLEEEKSEYVLVTAVDTATNTVTVQRNIDGAGSITFVTTNHFQRIGTAHEEGSGKPTAVANLGYVKFNYTQIFRNLWSVTGTAAAVDFHTGSAIAKNKADCALYHSEDIERSMIWGKKAIGTKNGSPFRMADGMYNLISTNVTAAGATTSWNDFDDFCKTIFSKNIKGKPNERIAFTGNGGLQVINQIAMENGQMNLTAGQTSFGLAVTKMITPYGNISLMTHPLFTENPVWTKDLMILHPGAIRVRPLRKTNIEAYDQNGTRAGVDADYGVYTSEMSWELRAEITSGMLTGLTAGITNT